MILSFDKFEKYEMPQVTLCNPNSRATEVDGKITITDTVGVLLNPSGMNLKLNFNAPHELSFDYYRHKSTDPINQSFYDSIYESIQTDRYVYLTDIGYFIISNTTDSDADNIDKKSITCKSCEENELATAEGLYLKEGTYYLHTEDNKGLLDLFLPKTAGWTMGYVDPSLLTKPYYVEETDVGNGYNFLYTTIQAMFECIVEADIIKRTISVYSRVYYAENHLTDIHIAKYNLLKHKIVEENDEDKYSALNVQGKDESLEIRAVNPTGKNVIYNFEPRYSWMSLALQTAIEKWQEKCKSVEDEYLTRQQEYYTELEKLFNEEQDIEILKGELKELIQTQEFIIIGDYDQEQYPTQQAALTAKNAQISDKQTEINTATSAYNAHRSAVQTEYEKPINQINADCALDITAIDIEGEQIFTLDLLNELMTHIKPTDYVDEHMLVTESMTYSEKFEKAKELMDRAKSQLVKISSGQKTYSINTRSFLFNKQFKHFSEQLCAGAIIYVETKNDTMEQLHLTGININYDEKSASFILGNKYDRSDLKALYDDALGKNSKSFTELKYIASIIEEQQKQLDHQQNWVAELRTLTLDNVLTSEDQAIEINNRGLIGRKRQLNEDCSWKTDENGNPLFYAEQVKLINNTLVFTEDNWETAVTAVGKIAVGYNHDGSVKYAYGINGQVLIGELMLGSNLILTGRSAGIKIKDRNGNNVFYADDDGNLILSGTIFAEKGQIGGWNILTNAIDKTFAKDGHTYRACIQSSTNLDSAAFVVQKDGQNQFYVTYGGKMYAGNAEINGKVTADSGNIGGWNIQSGQIEKKLTLNGHTYRSALQSSGNTETAAFLVQVDGANHFYVTYGGKLYAKNAEIEGKITATSGTIGGCTINNNTLTISNINISSLNGSKITEGTVNAARVGGIRQGGTISKWTTTADGLHFSQPGNNVTIQADTLMVGEGTGGGSVRWYFVYGAGKEYENQRSDLNLKNSIEDLSDSYEILFDTLHPRRYKYNNGTSNRYHTGFVAQEVVGALTIANLSTSDLAAACYEDLGDERSYWWLRRDEFVALNTWQIQKAKARITALENTVAELKTQIQTLTAG